MLDMRGSAQTSERKPARMAKMHGEYLGSTNLKRLAFFGNT